MKAPLTHLNGKHQLEAICRDKHAVAGLEKKKLKNSYKNAT
jgi:hypothetical protein